MGNTEDKYCSTSNPSADFETRKISLVVFARLLCVTYSYLKGAREVLEETKITAGDQSKQQAITFYDNKFGSLVPLKAAYFIQ